MSDETSRRPSLWRRLRVSPIGLTLAVVTFLVLGGTGGAFAYWAVTASMSTTATAATLAVTGTWTVPLDATFTNVSYSKTGEFTVANTTAMNTAARPYTVNFAVSGGSPGPLATALQVIVWKKVTSCAVVGASPSTGLWGGVAPTVSGTVANGVPDVWCVLTKVDERSSLASATGSVSITSSLTATLSAGTNWITTSSPATAVQSTEFIYPAFTPGANWYRLKTSVSGKECSDVRGNGGNGTDVIAFSCNVPASGNQILKFLPTDTGYLKIAFKNNTALQVGVAGAVTTVGAAVQVQSTATTDGSQEWQLQNKGSGIYQIVNRKSGLCIEPDLADTAATPVFKQEVCSDLAPQQFTLEQFENPAFATFTCTNTGSGSSRSFKLDWTGALQDDVTVQVRQNSTGAWQTNGTALAGTSTYTIKDRATLVTWDKNNVHQYQVVGAWGTVLATGNFRALHHSWDFLDWDDYNYLRCGS